MSTQTSKTWIEKLWDKKVPQYLGTYLAVGFTLLQFLEFITNRYQWGNYWVDKYLLVWLTLLPAIIILIYFGGRLSSKSGLAQPKWPKAFVISNLVVAFVLGGIFFNGAAADQGEVVQLTNEEGETISAVVPSLQKVKTLACFKFENLTGDEELEWWGNAFSNLLEVDLEQRAEFYVLSSYYLNGYNNQMGLGTFQIPNVAMQRDIATKARTDYFTRLAFDIQENQYQLKGQVFATKDGKSVMDIEVKDQDPFAAIDAVKQQIFENIPDAFEALENQVSLPVSSLISGNQEALKYFTQSRITYYNNPTGLEEVVQLAKKSVEADPTCAECYFFVADPLYGQGKTEESIAYTKKAIQYGNALPQRMQFKYKSVLYRISNQMEAFIKLQEMRRKMYPFEYDAYQTLLNVYKVNYGIDSAKALIQEAINYGNLEKGLLSLYSLQVENEEFAEAEQTLNQLTKEFPDRDQDRLKFATVYDRSGQLDKAREVLLEEETLDPLNTNIQSRLGYLDFKSQNFEAAEKRVKTQLQQASSLVDSLIFLSMEQYFYLQRGQIEKAIEALAVLEKYQSKRAPINRILTENFFTKVNMYNSIGQGAKNAQLLAELNKYSPEDTPLYTCLTEGYTILEDFPASMEIDEFASCRENFTAYGEGYVKLFEVMLAYAKQDIPTCIEIMSADNGRVQDLFQDYIIAKIFAKGGDTEQAKTILQKVLDETTYEPAIYYHMAVLLEEQDPKHAQEYLAIAMDYWSVADPDYIPMQQAQSLAARLEIMVK